MKIYYKTNNISKLMIKTNFQKQVIFEIKLLRLFIKYRQEVNSINLHFVVK